MGRLRHAGGARGAGRCGEARLQPVEEIASVISIEAKVGVARVADLRWGTVERHRRPVLAKTGNELVALTGDSFAFGAGVLTADESGGGAHADTQRYRYGARTQTILLSAAMDQGAHAILQGMADEQRTDPLGPVDLVA